MLTQLQPLTEEEFAASASEQSREDASMEVYELVHICPKLKVECH